MTQADMEARLHKAWDWCEANKRNPKHAAKFAIYEDSFIAELRDYEQAYRLSHTTHALVDIA